tara:strand:- start:187 stop:441 length:255 start_codon:yes stop_codon:yes gene_type:complete
MFGGGLLFDIERLPSTTNRGTSAMKRTVLSAAIFAFVMALGVPAASTAVLAADKKENPCAKMTDKAEKKACMKAQADAKKATKK